MINGAIVGGSGYIGGELIRLLLSHPSINLVSITANEMAGLPIAKSHPSLCHVNMYFNELHDIQDANVLFLAVPHGKAMELMNQFPAKTIIDTSADFRLHNKNEFEKFYKNKHTAFDQINTFSYGLPELFRSNIKLAKNIASPGCFATAAILSIFPLISEKLGDEVIINAVTGSSGSGIKPQQKTHHAFREDSYFAYESFTHRHIPEIKQAIWDKTATNIELIFQPHSGPFIRGIYMTSIIKLKHKITKEEVVNIYKQYYASEYFIRLLDHPPNVKWVKNTNFCDLHVDTNGCIAVITVAIDNLLKGGAAQALQCFNLLHQLDETTGLQFLAANP